MLGLRTSRPRASRTRRARPDADGRRSAAVAAKEALQADRTLEVVAMELRIAANAVGEVVGRTATEDLLDAVFSQFCLGK